MSKPVNLFISPHLDDVALSCGGFIHRLTAAGEVVVIVTVATADIPLGVPLSRGAQWRHMVWRLNDSPFAVRCREDAAAGMILKAQYIHLGLLDAIYRCDENRKPLYNNIIRHIPVHPNDWTNYEPIVRNKIQETLSGWEGAKVRVFCPLAIGENVDHIIVRIAVENVCELNKLIYYEDYPYVARLDDFQPQIKLDFSTKNWHSTTLELTDVEIEARITATACYISQIPILFPSELQYLQNRILFHFPRIGRFLNWSIGMNTSRQRIALSLKSDIARSGGERYWSRNVEDDLIIETAHTQTA